MSKIKIPILGIVLLIGLMLTGCAWYYGGYGYHDYSYDNFGYEYYGYPYYHDYYEWDAVGHHHHH